VRGSHILTFKHFGLSAKVFSLLRGWMRQQHINTHIG
jgi:hypothetical protein